MEKLVILDYLNKSVHIYNIENDADIDELYLENLGFNTNNCYWMFFENLKIKFEEEILK